MPKPEAPTSAYLRLPHKRRDFVDAYFACKFNGTQAAIKAGYSKKTAISQAERLLTFVDVKAAIDERRAEIEKASMLKAIDVVEELRKIGFSDITNIISWRGNVVTMKDSADLPPGMSACISEITETTTENGSVLKIKLHNKIAALELVSRLLGFDVNKADESERLAKVKAAVRDVIEALNQAKQPAEVKQ